MLAARFLLLIYFNATLGTLLPVAVDVAAHLFWRHEHLQHVHHGQARHGHLGDEMARFAAGNNGPGHSDAGSIVDFSSKIALSAHLSPIPVALAKPVWETFRRRPHTAPDGLLLKPFLPVYSPPPDGA